MRGVGKDEPRDPTVRAVEMELGVFVTVIVVFSDAAMLTGDRGATAAEE